MIKKFVEWAKMKNDELNRCGYQTEIVGPVGLSQQFAYLDIVIKDSIRATITGHSIGELQNGEFQNGEFELEAWNSNPVEDIYFDYLELSSGANFDEEFKGLFAALAAKV
jgi:hypothetical protein